MCDCKRDGLWVRFSLEEMEYFKFLFLHSSVEAKRGVEFRHSTRNASEGGSGGSVLMATECLNTRFPGSSCLPCYLWGV